MGGNVGKLFEFCVGTLQFRCFLGKRFGRRLFLEKNSPFDRKPLSLPFLFPLALAQQINLFGLSPDLFGLFIKIDEDPDLGPQNISINRFDQVIDRPKRIATRDLRLLPAHSRQENDGCIARSRTLTNDCGNVEPIHSRQAHIENNYGKIALEQFAKGLFTAGAFDEVLPQ